MVKVKYFLVLALMLVSTVVISACSPITTETNTGTDMMRYACNVPDCGYLYDPKRGDTDYGIAPGTPFKDIPDEWRCPICGVPKEEFYAVGD